ncbi:MAG: FAD-dependent monooxygenase, partial [Rhodococcus fascians]
DVIVVGGGPVGMLVAAELALQGVRVIVLEARTEVDERPRAGTVHARTLSLLARRGYVAGSPADALADSAGRVRRTPFQFAAQPILTITAPAAEPAPIAGIPQARLEAAFEARARELGATIARGNTVTAVEAGSDSVRVEFAPVESPHEVTSIVARYCVGADGARSTVARSGDFPEVDYPATMNAIAALAVPVSDRQPPPGWNSTPTGWTMHNPNPYGKSRLIAMDFSGPAERGVVPTESEYIDTLGTVLGAEQDVSDVSHLTRFSDYGRYRTRLHDGRLLLAGDAAHVHYPLGGQGLNSGMQDAIALGWRLARVLRGHDAPSVFEDYSRERVAVADAVVGNTVLQSRMMNPATTDLRDAVSAMLRVPQVHDAIADLISGQFQENFQHDLVVTDDDGEAQTLSSLLTAGRFVAIRPDEHTPLPSLPADTIVATGKVAPEQPWTTAVIRPDGYLAVID